MGLGQGRRLLSNRYELQDEIGRGGAGRVYRAHDLRLDRAVAVKVLTALHETAVERFRREAATAARIQHPNVVTLHDAGLDDEVPYLVMHLVEGPSLADRVEQHGPLEPADCRRLAEDLLAGVAATHATGVLHRDLTPRNILFDPDGSALLSDFGIARGPEDSTLTGVATVMGTRPYVAPERLDGLPATVASDLFAVGVTLRFAISGHHASPVPPDHELAALVGACTHRDPGQRPRDADAALALLPTTSADADVVPTTQPLRVGPPLVADTDETPLTPPSGTSTSPDDRLPLLRRPAAIVVGLLLLALAAIVGSDAVNQAPEGEADDSEVTDAPSFDPADPAGSARRLAEWLQDG